jgi:hypothetical protein
MNEQMSFSGPRGRSVSSRNSSVSVSGAPASISTYQQLTACVSNAIQTAMINADPKLKAQRQAELAAKAEAERDKAMLQASLVTPPPPPPQPQPPRPLPPALPARPSTKYPTLKSPIAIPPSSTNSSSLLQVQTDESKWEYKWSSGSNEQIHGPFRSREMQVWATQGFFGSDTILMHRIGDDNNSWKPGRDVLPIIANEATTLNANANNNNNNNTNSNTTSNGGYHHNQSNLPQLTISTTPVVDTNASPLPSPLSTPLGSASPSPSPLSTLPSRLSDNALALLLKAKSRSPAPLPPFGGGQTPSRSSVNNLATPTTPSGAISNFSSGVSPIGGSHPLSASASPITSPSNWSPSAASSLATSTSSTNGGVFERMASSDSPTLSTSTIQAVMIDTPNQSNRRIRAHRRAGQIRSSQELLDGSDFLAEVMAAEAAANAPPPSRPGSGNFDAFAIMTFNGTTTPPRSRGGSMVGIVMTSPPPGASSSSSSLLSASLSMVRPGSSHQLSDMGLPPLPASAGRLSITSINASAPPTPPSPQNVLYGTSPSTNTLLLSPVALSPSSSGTTTGPLTSISEGSVAATASIPVNTAVTSQSQSQPQQSQQAQQRVPPPLPTTAPRRRPPIISGSRIVAGGSTTPTATSATTAIASPSQATNGDATSLPSSLPLPSSPST